MKIKQIISVLPCVVVVLSTLLHAQRVDTIRANPDAVQLRKIWQVTGGEFGGGRVGSGVGSVGDINGDGLDDWAVNYGDANEWRIFYGSRDGLSTTPVVTISRAGGAYPVVGDFWGTGHKAVGFPSGYRANGHYYYGLQLFRTDSNRVDTSTVIYLDLYKFNPPLRETIPTSLMGVDLDGNGSDELVMMFEGRIVESNVIRRPEVWIYRGGPSFQVDTPTVIITDSEEHGMKGRQSLVIGEADGDGRLDLITGSDYADGTQKQKMYFSNPGSPWNWSEPDRVIQMSNFVPLDCDGDGLLDIAVGNVSLFLSHGKDIRTRSFASEDVDRQFFAPYSRFVPGRVGFLSDSGRRYEMLDIRFNGVDHFLGGGPNGPDGFYEAFVGFEALAYKEPLGDIDGDGWNELLGGWPDVNFNAGIAAIYAGGPYIPRDPSLSVRHIATEERKDAISIWPNPATTEVHIAWRGDLKRMPRGFRVYDMQGRLVAEGEVASWRGEAGWECGEQPAGVYTLAILDYQGEQIAATRIIKP